MIANVNRGKGQSAYKLQDFLLKFGEEGSQRKKQTWQEQEAMLLLLAKAYSTKVSADG